MLKYLPDTRVVNVSTRAKRTTNELQMPLEILENVDEIKTSAPL